jgi:hypothetical protein
MTLGELIPTFRDWSSGMRRYDTGWMDSDVSGMVFWDVTLRRWDTWILTFRDWSSGMSRYVVALSGFRRFGTVLQEFNTTSLGWVDSDVSGLSFWNMTLSRWHKWIPTFRDWSSVIWRYDIGWVDSDVSKEHSAFIFNVQAVQEWLTTHHRTRQTEGVLST